MQFRGSSENLKAADTVFSLIQALGNPKESTRILKDIQAKIEDLEAATAKHEDRIAKVGKIEDIERLHAEAMADRNAAADDIAEATVRADEIVTDARKKADGIAAVIGKRNASSLAREKKLEKAEQKVARREKEAAAAKKAADSRMKEAAATKAEYTYLLDRLKKAME